MLDSFFEAHGLSLDVGSEKAASNLDGHRTCGRLHHGLRSQANRIRRPSPYTLKMAVRVGASVLAEILEHKRSEVADLHARAATLEQAAFERKSPVRPFAEALRAHAPAIIAEIKKASPSKGVLRREFHPAFLAHAYEQGGAACLSVLTDKHFFQGSLLDLEAARAAVAVPVLRKDFVIDRLQIFEAAAHGADAILLIAAALDTNALISFRELARSLGMASLVEVHDRDELARAVDSGAEIIGVNNRSLETFEVSLETSVRLSLLLPSNVVKVSESGIHSAADIQMLRTAGYDAFLVGESLVRAADATAALRALMSEKA